MLFNVPDSLRQYSGIYSITNSIDNRFYVGSTICFKRRFQDHKSGFKSKKHPNKYLQAFVNKYGIDKLSFNILYPCKNTCLVYNEKLWIDSLKPQFNIKKIITRPYFEDEVRFNEAEFLKILSKMSTPLSNIDLGIEFKITETDGCFFQNYIKKQQQEMKEGSYIKKEKFKLSRYPKERKRQLNILIKEIKKEYRT